jgi:hypothetical protein
VRRKVSGGADGEGGRACWPKGGKGVCGREGGREGG